MPKSHNQCVENSRKMGLTVLDQIHGSQLSKGSTQTVSSHLYRVARVSGQQGLHLSDNLRDDSLLSLVKTLVDLAVAVGEGGVGGLEGIQVGDPVLNGLRSSEDDIDRLVRGQIANITLGVSQLVVDGVGMHETTSGALEGVRSIGILAAVSCSTQPQRFLGLRSIVAGEGRIKILSLGQCDGKDNKRHTQLDEERKCRHNQKTVGICQKFRVLNKSN